MLIFVKMQNWIKWQTDTCSSVQNVQKTAGIPVIADKGTPALRNILSKSRFFLFHSGQK